MIVSFTDADGDHFMATPDVDMKFMDGACPRATRVAFTYAHGDEWFPYIESTEYRRLYVGLTEAEAAIWVATGRLPGDQEVK